MTGFQVLQAVGGTVYLVAISVVSIRLLLLAKRTRRIPELLLGSGMFLGGSLGASLEAGGMAAMVEIGPAIAGPMLMGGKLFGVLGMTLQAFFIRHVFRPKGIGSLITVAVIVVTLMATFVGLWIHGTFSSGLIPTSWLLIEFGARVMAPVWMGIESVRYWVLMRRRVRIGLAKPIVANRFFLWAISSLSGFTILLTSLPPVLLDPVAHRFWVSLDLLTFSVAGVVTSICYWLVLMPPEFYVRWFKRAETNTQAAEGSA